MKNYMIAVKAEIDKATSRKHRNLLPAGCAGFLFEIHAEDSETAIDVSLSMTRHWSRLYELDVITTAADITP